MQLSGIQEKGLDILSLYLLLPVEMTEQLAHTLFLYVVQVRGLPGLIRVNFIPGY